MCAHFTSMGEVDTKPINSVQAALTLFGEKGDRSKDRTNNSDEFDRDEELDGLLKGLSNLKVQIEAKELANKQATLKLENYVKKIDELSTIAKNSEIEKEVYVNECKEARAKVQELEFKINVMSNQLLESVKIREQVSLLENELVSVNGELLQMEADLADSENTKVEALRRARILETDWKTVNEKYEEMCVLQTDKEVEMMLITRKVEETGEEFERMRKQIEINELEMESQIKKSEDQAGYIKLLEAELDRLRVENKNANEEEKQLYPDFENVKIELQRTKIELEDIRKREIEAQIEIAILKSEIHKGRSRIAEVEAVEERLKGENGSLYIAVKQLGLEVEEAKNENKILRKTQDESDETNNFIKIPKEEYEAWVEKSAKGKQNDELEKLRSDLENANAKIGELRARVEQATSRAEVAEKGKADVEDRITRWRERREKRKNAIAALHEDLIPEKSTSYGYSKGASSSQVHKAYQPLGKVLNMKF